MAEMGKLCKRCNHPASWHRVDDSDTGTPETWKTRCIGYDCEAPGPPPKTNPCDCPDFVEAMD